MDGDEQEREPVQRDDAAGGEYTYGNSRLLCLFLDLDLSQAHFGPDQVFYILSTSFRMSALVRLSGLAVVESDTVLPGPISFTSTYSAGGLAHNRHGA